MAEVAHDGAAGAAPLAAVAPLLDALAAQLEPLERVCVAFSGGVDSSVVLAVAARMLGAAQVLAFTAVSETYRDDELTAARSLAAGLGVRHLTWQTRELDDQRFVANSRDRCYYCKATLIEAMVAAAAEAGVTALIDGANRDDLGDERPGMRASAERGVRHPLIEAGLGKADVRTLARALDLPVWSKPAEACLASRIAYDEPVTGDKLRQVAAAEDVLRELGLGPVLRVRHHGDIARIELAADAVSRAAEPAVRDAIVRRLRALGFTFVTLDLQGFRSGSMNEAPAIPKGAA
jgi:pyridinium-3,5-biscarboxylic acid mononucleotide sulfurtransferase